MNSTIWLGVAAVKRLRQWLADRRWRREQPAREAWVTLYDTNGNAVHTSPAILAPTTEGKFANDGVVTFGPMAARATVTHITVTDADGNEHTIQL